MHTEWSPTTRAGPPATAGNPQRCRVKIFHANFPRIMGVYCPLSRSFPLPSLCRIDHCAKKPAAAPSPAASRKARLCVSRPGWTQRSRAWAPALALRAAPARQRRQRQRRHPQTAVRSGAAAPHQRQCRSRRRCQCCGHHARCYGAGGVPPGGTLRHLLWTPQRRRHRLGILLPHRCANCDPLLLLVPFLIGVPPLQSAVAGCMVT